MWLVIFSIKFSRSVVSSAHDWTTQAMQRCSQRSQSCAPRICRVRLFLAARVNLGFFHSEALHVRAQVSDSRRVAPPTRRVRIFCIRTVRRVLGGRAAAFASEVTRRLDSSYVRRHKWRGSDRGVSDTDVPTMVALSYSQLQWLLTQQLQHSGTTDCQYGDEESIVRGPPDPRSLINMCWYRVECYTFWEVFRVS